MATPQDNGLQRPSDEYVKDVCKVGLGACCCRYLTADQHGWACQKFTDMAKFIDRRVLGGLMVATGDNCEGRGSQ